MQLDNKSSPTFQYLQKEKNTNYQLAPTGMHRRNAEEKAIRTFKEHFIAGLYVMDPDFQIKNWERLLEKA